MTEPETPTRRPVPALARARSFAPAGTAARPLSYPLARRLSPALAPYRFELRVYWEDTDAGGVVFYANHLKFFERARTEWLRSLGHEQEKLRTEQGVIFIVAETHVRYLRPARLDDLLSVSVEVTHPGLAQLTLAQQAFRRSADGTEQPIADGTIRIGCVDARTHRPRRIPDALAESFHSTTPHDRHPDV